MIRMRLLLLIALTGAAVYRCTVTQVAGGDASGAGNARVSAAVQYADGNPAAGCAVIVRPADYLADTATANFNKARRAVLQTATDRNGRFHLDSMDAGAYAAEVTDEESAAVLIRFAIEHNDEIRELPSATMRPCGAIRDTLPAAPEDGSVFVLIYGLERAVKVSPDGSFAVDKLPADTFALRIISSAPSFDSRDIEKIAVPENGAASVDPARLLPKKRVITINTAASGANVSESVVDFPLLVRLDAANFDFDAAAPAGADLHFTSARGAPLPCQVDFWDQTAKKAAVWVRIDTIRGDTDSQFVHLYWGDADTHTAAGGNNVFDSTLGYAGVWHLQQLDDATGNGNDGTANGTIAQPGVIGAARSFNGQDEYIDCGADASLAMSGEVTVSAWVWLADDTTDRYMRIVTSKTAPTQPGGFELECNARHEHESYLTLITGTPHQFVRSYTIGWQAGEWYQVTGVVSDTTGALYRNGVRVAIAQPKIDSLTPSSTSLRIGGWSTDYFHGRIDEVRVEHVARHDAWITLCYENQKPNQVMVTIE